MEVGISVSYNIKKVTAEQREKKGRAAEFLCERCACSAISAVKSKCQFLIHIRSQLSVAA